MRYADEMRGSEGERCTVRGRTGTVVKVVEEGRRALVALDDDDTYTFNYDEIQLLGDETP